MDKISPWRTGVVLGKDGRIINEYRFEDHAIDPLMDDDTYKLYNDLLKGTRDPDMGKFIVVEAPAAHPLMDDDTYKLYNDLND